jgi:2-polyprenyl-3-methyl-5-hydroxy-6-metoxy-1,4-benzoquinol methylase
MSCSCYGFSDTAEKHFTSEDAAAEIARYRKKGPGPTTRLLMDGLARGGPINGSVLDVGAGVGALSFELLDRGAERVTIVDASSAYLEMAADESRRRNRSAVTQVVAGDFVAMSRELASAHIVTLDRVVCCYPEYRPLVRQAADHAENRFAYSYPRDRWFVRLGVGWRIS